MKVLNDFRNVICHGNIIYSFNKFKNIGFISDFLNNVLKVENIKIKSISISIIILLLNYFNQHKNSSKTIDLFIKKIRSLKKNLDKESFSYLENKMNLKILKLIK